MTRREAFEIFALLAFLAFDIVFLWPVSHIWAFWLALIIGAAFFLSHLTLRVGAISAVALLLSGLIVQRFIPPTETETHGWLIPGNDESPPLPTSCSPEFTYGLRVYFGNNVATMTHPLRPPDRWDLLVFKGTPTLWAEMAGPNLTISADLCTENGIAAKIRHNEITINPANIFNIDRPDKSTLIVRDNWDREVIHLRYLNPSAVQLSGLFYIQPRYPPIIIGQNCLSIGEEKIMCGSCLHGGMGAIVIP